MFLIKSGLTNTFYQYQCNNIPQVKKYINEITRTNSTTADWKKLCEEAKNNTGEQSVDYIFFDENGVEYDCIVYVEFDITNRTYLVWVEYDA